MKKNLQKKTTPTDAASRPSAGDILNRQLSAVPMLNRAVRSQKLENGRIRLSIPLKKRWWAQALSTLLPLRRQRVMELDSVGSEIFSLCDGTHNVEKIIQLFADKWQLSFFEARASVFDFLRRLMLDQIIVLHLPEPKS